MDRLRRADDASRAARRDWIRERFDIRTMQATYRDALRALASETDADRRHRDFCLRLLREPLVP